MTNSHPLRSRACAAAAILLGCVAAPAAFADDAAPTPALQARLDALQQITVTEARGPAADVAAPSAEVSDVLRAAADDEAGPASPSAVDATGAAAR